MDHVITIPYGFLILNTIFPQVKAHRNTLQIINLRSKLKTYKDKCFGYKSQSLQTIDMYHI